MTNQLTLEFTAGPTGPAVNLDDLREKHRESIRQIRFQRCRAEIEEQQAQQKADTQRLNEEFEINQQELFNRFALTLDDAFMARIEEKLIFSENLSADEIDFANENFWIPEGFKFGNFGLIPVNQ